MNFEKQEIRLNDVRRMGFLRVPSYFPKENRPILYLPVADFSNRASNGNTLGVMVRVIDALLDRHRTERGLIHAISYRLTKHIIAYSRHQDRIITHPDAGDRARALEQLITSESPLVLVSPSFERGVDLYGDRARFQVITKLPFLDLGDPQTRKRRYAGGIHGPGERWYTLETARVLVQACGRIIRSADDWGFTYILDERWPRFYEQMKNDFPPWFREACHW